MNKYLGIVEIIIIISNLILQKNGFGAVMSCDVQTLYF